MGGDALLFQEPPPSFSPPEFPPRLRWILRVSFSRSFFCLPPSRITLVSGGRTHLALPLRYRHVPRHAVVLLRGLCPQGGVPISNARNRLLSVGLSEAYNKSFEIVPQRFQPVLRRTASARPGPRNFRNISRSGSGSSCWLAGALANRNSPLSGNRSRRIGSRSSLERFGIR